MLNATLRIAAVVITALALATVAIAAEPVTRLSAEDLLRLARPTAGECYLTKPPAMVTGAPVILGDLRLEPQAAEGLKPEELERKDRDRGQLKESWR